MYLPIQLGCLILVRRWKVAKKQGGPMGMRGSGLGIEKLASTMRTKIAVVVATVMAAVQAVHLLNVAACLTVKVEKTSLLSLTNFK
jgi:hypothetical protein